MPHFTYTASRIRQALEKAKLPISREIEVSGSRIMVYAEDEHGQFDSTRTDELYDAVRKVFPTCSSKQYGSGVWVLQTPEPSRPSSTSMRATRPARFTTETPMSRYVPPPCSGCQKSMTDFHPYDDYMLTREVWLHLHPAGPRGLLCHQCLEQRATAACHTWHTTHFVPVLCYINRHIQGVQWARKRLAETSNPTLMASVAEGQDRRIIRLGLPSMPKFLAHLASVNNAPDSRKHQD